MENCNTILIVEDDDDIRISLKLALENEGYTVVAASNGQLALELLTQIEKPALIFLDIMMPIMDGHQFLEVLRQDIALAPIPVVVTSASTNSKEVIGANNFIRKPFDLDMIIQMAKKYCGSSD